MNKVSSEQIEHLMDSLTFVFSRVGATMTTCHGRLPNGFMVGYGESACVDPEEFNEHLGRKYAKERCVADALDKLWFAEGYMLAMTGKVSPGFTHE